MVQTTLTYYDPEYPTTIAPGFISTLLDDENFTYHQRYQLLNTKPDIKLIARPYTTPTTTIITTSSSSTTTPITLIPTHNKTQPLTYIHRSLPIRLAVTLFQNYELVVDGNEHESENLIMYITLPNNVEGQAVLGIVNWVSMIAQTGKGGLRLGIEFEGLGLGLECDKGGEREYGRRLRELRRAVVELGVWELGCVLDGNGNWDLDLDGNGDGGKGDKVDGEGEGDKVDGEGEGEGEGQGDEHGKVDEEVSVGVGVSPGIDVNMNVGVSIGTVMTTNTDAKMGTKREGLPAVRDSETA